MKWDIQCWINCRIYECGILKEIYAKNHVYQYDADDFDFEQVKVGKIACKFDEVDKQHIYYYYN